MSDIAISRASADDGGAFRLRTVIILLALGILGFGALMVGSAYTPDRSENSGGNPGHALSNSAVGYTGIVRLARALGYNTRVIRDEHLLDDGSLLILTPPAASTPLGPILSRRADLPTLVVLPKWETVPKRDHAGWVNRWGLTLKSEPEGVLAPDNKLTVTRVKSGGLPLRSAGWLSQEFGLNAPRPLQTISGTTLKPLLTDGEGRIVLGEIGDKPLYVLADPDLLSNMGMREEAQAGGAIALLKALNDNTDRDFDFDVTLVGFGKPKNPLRLMFDPPFLAMTLAVLATLILVGWQAFARFGPAVHRQRAIAFGKTALVDNAAGLVRKAGKQARMGGRYVEAIRERAVIAFGVPARLRGPAIDAYLDKLSGRAKFTDLAQATDDARDKASLVAAARALHYWQKEKGK